MIIMKFGGTSVGGANEIKNVANIVKSNIDKKPVVVVSAVKGTTDKLIELSYKSSEGKSEDLFDSIKDAHYEILEKLSLDKNLLEKDFESLGYAIKKFNGKDIDAKALDAFQSF